MAITFVSQGTTPTGTGTGTGSTSVTPALPGTIADGDVVLILVADKPDTATPTTPTNWTLAGTVAGGTGTTGSGTGPVRTTVFYRVKDASWSTMPAVAITSGNAAIAQAFVYRVAAGSTWNIAAAGGADTSAGTGWSVTASTNPGITSGDWVFVAGAYPTTGQTFSAESVSATGATFGSMIERMDTANTTTNNDVGAFAYQMICTGGTSTAAPVMTATSSSATNSAGPMLLVRMREVVSSTVQKTASDTAAISIDESYVMPRPQFKWQHFNNGTEGTAITTANSATSGDALENTAVSTGASLTYEAASAIRGTMGARAVGGSTHNANFRLSVDYPTQDISAQVYFRVNTFPTVAAGPIFRITDSANTVGPRVTLNLSNQLNFQDAGGTSLKISPTLSAGTDYRLQVQSDRGTTTTNGYIAYQLYDGNDVLIDSFSSSTVNAIGTTIDFQKIAVGKLGTTVETFDISFDELSIQSETISEIAPVPPSVTNVTKSASDTAAISISENTSSFRTVVASDTASISIADASTSFRTIVASDGASISIADTSARSTELPGTDTSAISISETTNISVQVSASDTAAITINDTSARVSVEAKGVINLFPTPTFDTSNSVSESISLFAIEKYWDTQYSWSNTENHTGSGGSLRAVPGAGDINNNQTGVILWPRGHNTTSAPAGSTFSLYARVKGPAGRVIEVSTRQITAQAYISEGIVGAYNHTLTGGWDLIKIENATSTGEYTNGLQFRTPNASLATDEFYIDNVEIYYHGVNPGGRDGAGLVINESASVVVAVTASDTSAIGISDTSSTFKSIVASDSAAITITEASSASKDMPGAETIGLSIAEQASIFVTQVASDSSAISVAETTSSARTITASDSAAINVAETTEFFKERESSDAASISVVDASTSFRTIVASDSAAITVTETSVAGKDLPGTETIGLGITESASIVVSFTSSDSAAISIADSSEITDIGAITSKSASDTAAISVAETSNRAITGESKTGSDSASISVAEATSLFKTVVASDSAALTITEASNPRKDLPGTDTTALAIAEQASVFVTVASTDGASLGISDASSGVVSVASSDSAGISVTETTSSFREVSASDTAAITISDVAFNGAPIDKPGADAAAISISETTQIFVTVVGVDSGIISVTENKTNNKTHRITDNSGSVDTLIVSTAKKIIVLEDTSGSTDPGFTEFSGHGETLSDNSGVTDAGFEQSELTYPGEVISDNSGSTDAGFEQRAATTESLQDSSGNTDSVSIRSFVISINGTETTALKITESVNLVKSVSAKVESLFDDSGVTDAVAIDNFVIRKPGTDGAALGITEASQVLVRVSASDTAALGITETRTTSVSTAPGTDSAGLRITETAAVRVMLTASDTAAIAIAESKEVRNLTGYTVKVYVNGQWRVGRILVRRNGVWVSPVIRVYRGGNWTLG